MLKLCCIDCFAYDTIIIFIKVNGSGKGGCYFCQDNSKNCIKPSELVGLSSGLILFLHNQLIEAQWLAEVKVSPENGPLKCSSKNCLLLERINARMLS